MKREIEQKFALRDPEALLERLAALRAAALPADFEVNHIFDTSDRRLLAADCGLRVRECRSPGDAAAGRATVTFKGPRQPGLTKVRDEIETTVGDAAVICELLGRLGFREVLVFEKRRRTWRAQDCQVMIDELPQLGWYAEIEGPTIEAIEALRAALGLQNQPPIAETYVELVVQHATRDPDGCRRLTF